MAVASGVEIGDQLALLAFDLVLEHQFAFLQALDLDLVDVDVHGEPGDHLVQVAVLDAELAQFFHVAEKLAVDVVFLFVFLFFILGNNTNGLSKMWSGKVI